MIPTIFQIYDSPNPKGTNIYRFEPKIEPSQTCFFLNGPTLNPQIKELKKRGDNKTRKEKGTREEHGFVNGQKRDS